MHTGGIGPPARGSGPTELFLRFRRMMRDWTGAKPVKRVVSFSPPEARRVSTHPQEGYHPAIPAMACMSLFLASRKGAVRLNRSELGDKSSMLRSLSVASAGCSPPVERVSSAPTRGMPSTTCLALVASICQS